MYEYYIIDIHVLYRQDNLGDKNVVWFWGELYRNNWKSGFPQKKGLHWFLHNEIEGENRDLANHSVSREFCFTKVWVLRGFPV